MRKNNKLINLNVIARTYLFSGVIALTIFSLVASPLAYSQELSQRELIVTPSVLESYLLDDNIDILRSLNQVAKARDTVHLARADLLPSLSLSIILSTANPMFALSAVTCLVPFIFPASWFGFSSAKNALKAEKYGVHISKLNLYAIALTLLYRVSGDETAYLTMEEQFTRVQKYVESLRALAGAGLISNSDLLRGEIELNRFSIDLAKMRQLIVEERAAIRKMLNLPLDARFTIRTEQLGAVRFEDKKPEEIIQTVYAQSPERVQIAHLEKAARATVRATQWSFLTGCSGGQTGLISGSGGTSASLTNLSTGASMNLGFGIFPRVKIARRNLADIQLRDDELKLELAKQTESLASEIKETRLQSELAIQNVYFSEQLLAEQTELYDIGRASVKEILDTFGLLTAARVNAIQSNSALQGYRVAMQRLGLDGQFFPILNKSRIALETKR